MNFSPLINFLQLSSVKPKMTLVYIDFSTLCLLSKFTKINFVLLIYFFESCSVIPKVTLVYKDFSIFNCTLSF